MPWRTADILCEVLEERERQVERWGEENHPDGTGGVTRTILADAAKKACDDAANRGQLTWLRILDEEVKEALAESDEAKLRAELIQVAAVAVSWCEALDRRRKQRAREILEQGRGT